MPEDIVALSKRIARLKPNPDAVWFDDLCDDQTGLPENLSPFYIAPNRDAERGLTGTWRVGLLSKRPGDHPIVFDGAPGAFAAYRLMIDCFEAWQLIKPIEQVYFIGTRLEPGKLVKVGFSRDPKARLRALQTGHGEVLRIFATTPGGKDLEAKYHRRWSLRRRQGEWFQIGEPIIKEIERLSADAP